MSVMKSIVSELNAKKGGYCQITHKRGWLNFLADGELAFNGATLRRTIEQVVKNNEPRGTKLFLPERHFNFTMTADKEPNRPEEALERFIVNTNGSSFSNQISIGGKKESIDIGIRENGDTFTLVELKPWASTNSPMYAIVECLKNLVQYRTILKDDSRKIGRFKRVDLTILAPLSYYRQYEIVDEKDNCRKSIALTISRLLGDIGNAFVTTITLRALPLGEDEFYRKCAQIYDTRKVSGQKMIELNESDTIPSLRRDLWQLVATGE
jgi:hypothetical protein